MGQTKSFMATQLRPTAPVSRGVSPGERWRVTHKAGRGPTRSEPQKLTHRRRSKVRALGEHAWGLVKNSWAHRKVGYRGLKKNTVPLYTLFARTNLNMARYLLCDQAGTPLLSAS